jgi:predicted ATPase
LGEKIERFAYRIGRVILYPSHRIAIADGIVLGVAPAAFDVAVCFARNFGVLLSHEALVKGADLPAESKINLSALVAAAREMIGYRQSILNTFGQGWTNSAPVIVLTGEDAIPPAWALESRPVKLPSNRDILIGRESELAELEELLRNHRLVSLIGPTGIGKTRLAIDLGWRMVKWFRDGVALVDLAPVTDMAAAVSALARALNMPLQATDTPLEAIADAIRNRQKMVILDNCEPIGKIVAEMVKVLRARAPRLTLLLTSQHVLKGLDQQIYWLKGLAVPPKSVTDPTKLLEYSAVKFCVEYASAVDQNFAFDKSDTAGIAELCRRLDGVPQALAIVTSRMRTMGPDGVLDSFGEEFGTLQLSEGEIVPRHYSLVDMMEWSFGFLTPEEQHFLCRLTVFPSWFTAMEALDICAEGERGDALNCLVELENKSLVLRQGGAVPRFRLQEAQRIYATMRQKFYGD